MPTIIPALHIFHSLAPPFDGLYFMVNDTVYLPGATIPITDVGDSYPPGDQINQYLPGPSLVCVTSNVNTMCCRGSDHSGSGPVGNWFYPDGTIVLGNSANINGDITRSSHTQQIRLNRKRPDVMSPTGVYTCEVPDGSDNTITHRATITLIYYGECMTWIIPLMHNHWGEISVNANFFRGHWGGGINSGRTLIKN